MNLDLGTLAAVFSGSAAIGVVALRGATSQWQRLLLSGVLAGFFLYNGIGAAYPEVPGDYLLYYFGVLISFVAAFMVFKVTFLSVSRQAGLLLPRILKNVDTTPVWRWVIVVYLLLHLIPVVYPELRPAQLLAPRLVLLPTHLATRWGETGQPNYVLRVAEYASVLLTPFFYIALFRYRNRMYLAAVILLMQLYISFAIDSYISRSQVGIALGVIGLALWVSRPRQRRLLIVVATALLPLILMGNYVYAVVRIGGTVREIGLMDAAKWVWNVETSFPRNVAVPIIESGVRANLLDYIRWIITLPIPKILIGEVQRTHINCEISELVLGIRRGERGFYIVLPGLVGESVYVYGPHYFWLHGVLIGFLAALVIRLLERTPQFLFLNCYVVMLFAYVLNRGGLDGSLGYLINHFLLLYVFVLAAVFKRCPTSPLLPRALQDGARKA